MNIQQATVDEIPLVWYEPEGLEKRQLVIWLAGFSSDKETGIREAETIAKAGFLVLSFDPDQHGDRMDNTVEELRERVRNNIRRYFWPILANTTKETPKIIDWAIKNLSVEEKIGMGGVSMGGDIAVAAAGEDKRITAVSAMIATPDWLRPGSFESPGKPDKNAQAYYNQYNPLTHLENYVHCPAISFQSGADDQQVPPDGGLRFAEALSEIYVDCSDRIEVVLHKGVAHSTCEVMWKNSVAWFKRWLTG